MKCKWHDDEWETCVNVDCPYCTDYCPVTENQEVCKFSEEKENKND